MQNRTQPAESKIGSLFRSFFRALGEAFDKFDELPLETKQPMKEGVVNLLSRKPGNEEVIRVLTEGDSELIGILFNAGWWVLPKDINGPVKRELILLSRTGKVHEIDLCFSSLFHENDWGRLKERIHAWFALPYLATNANKKIVLASFDAHRAGNWIVAIPTLLPLIDGLMREFSNEYLGKTNNPNQALHVRRFAEYYRQKETKLFGESFVNFTNGQMFARIDLNSGNSLSSINRHAILHGKTSEYATEANSLRVFLMLDEVVRFVKAEENRRTAATPSSSRRN